MEPAMLYTNRFCCFFCFPHSVFTFTLTSFPFSIQSFFARRHQLGLKLSAFEHLNKKSRILQFRKVGKRGQKSFTTAVDHSGFSPEVFYTVRSVTLSDLFTYFCFCLPSASRLCAMFGFQWFSSPRNRSPQCSALESEIGEPWTFSGARRFAPCPSRRFCSMSRILKKCKLANVSHELLV